MLVHNKENNGQWKYLKIKEGVNMTFSLDDLEGMSKTEKEYLKSVGYKPSDRELATLCYQLYTDDPNLRITKLGGLMAQTTDETLKKQIEERVEYDKEEWDLLTSNPEGKYVFVIEHHDKEYDLDEVCGIFRHFVEAESYGIKKFQDERFEIHKYLIVDGELPDSEYVSVFNKGLFGEDNIKVERREYDGGDVGNATYEGKICRYYYVRGVSFDKRRNTDETDPERFENLFIPLPHPFDRGDLVSMKRGDREVYGIVEESREDWERFLKRVEDGLFADFYDASITVDFMNEKGDFMHDHICPMYLEKVDWESLPSSEDKEYLRYAMDLAKGQGTLDFFLLAYEERQGRSERIILNLHENNEEE